jgi:5-methylthioribose kinase
MREITAQNAAEYLRATGRASAAAPIEVRELSGGVSNVVLYVQQGETAFVLKQARPQLRVAQPWFCPVERNWRELAVLRACEMLLSTSPALGTSSAASSIVARTPAVLWEDRENFAFAMEAAPANHVVWKHILLTGGGNPGFAAAHVPIAAACGKLLARIHRASWRDAALREEFGDITLFDALRIDPYYRTVAAAVPALRQPLESLITSMSQHTLSLVHADFSPKNLLVYERDGRAELMMVDFETGHFGDPAFDLGFFLSHFMLKALHLPSGDEIYQQLLPAFWKTYLAARDDLDAAERAALSRRALLHAGACMAARIDGKSPVEYLTGPVQRDAARAIAEDLLTETRRDLGPAVTLA